MIGAARLPFFRSVAANWTLKAHVAAASGDTANVTTPAAVTTGANLIVLGLSRLAGVTPTISDSKGNTWTPLTDRSDSIGAFRFYRCINPIVGTNHTFMSASGAANYPTLYAAAFASGTALPSFDLQNGGTTLSTSTVQPGSITPTNNNSLVICGLEYFNGGLPSIGSGFTLLDRIDSAGGINFGGAMAYLIQTSKTPVNPTWTNAGYQNAAAAIASFAG